MKTLFFKIVILYHIVKNKLFPPYLGPAFVKYIGSKDDDEYTYTIFKLTVGKTYYAERQDGVSYYLKDDTNQLQEVVKYRFKDVSKERTKKLKKIGI